MSHIDAALTRYTRLTLEPYSPLIGAKLGGVDLSDPLDEILRTELRRALAQLGAP